MSFYSSLVVKHRSASGQLDRLWEFDPARRLVMLVIRVASEAPMSLDVDVCSLAHPRLGAHSIVRHDEHTWRIKPERFVELPQSTRDGQRVWSLVPEAYPIHPRFTRGDGILLAAAPSEVNAELEAL
jgi:hypothetical protein